MVYRRNCLKICIFIMVFFSSIVGGKIGGLSLNKISMIPLMLYLIIHSKKITLRKSLFPLSCFYLLGAFSAVLSLTSPYAVEVEGYISKSVFYAVQMILLFIPMLLLMSSSKEKEAILSSTVDAIVVTSRINIIIVFLEFVSYFIFDVSFTNGILKILYGIDNASALIYLPGIGIFLRPTGLNMDPAYLGVILVFGFIFENNLVWRMLGVVAAICSMSRSSILIIVAIAIISFIQNNGIKRIKKSYLVIMVLFVGVCILAIFAVPSINSQIDGLLSRFNIGNEMKSEDVGTMRHMLYIPKSIEVFLFYYNPIQKLFGFGPRLSGTIIAHAKVMDSYLNPEMFYAAWSIECDIAELLLGYGLVGFILYYFCLSKLRKVDVYGNNLFLVFFLYSIMYDISASTYAQFVLMVFLSCAFFLNQNGKEGKICQK